MVNREAMKTDAPTTQSFPKELSDLIKAEISLHSLYVISAYHKNIQQEIYLGPICNIIRKPTTYTLLIIAKKFPSKRLEDIMDDLYNKTEKRFKVYAIVYSLSNVKKRLNWGDNFLLGAIFQNNCIYKDDDSLSEFSNYGLSVHPTISQAIQEHWNVRMHRAGYLLSAIGCIHPDEDSISMLATMHCALEQICLGLLYLFWEFSPHHYSLPYLFHMCSHFTDLPQTMFPNDTYGSHRMYYMLCNAHHLMRFKIKKEFSHTDSDKAFNRCQSFFEKAKVLGDGHLEKLKGIHGQKID